MKFYIKRLFVFTLFISMTFAACKTSQSATDTIQKEVQSDKLENALLWKIEGNGISTPSYLYGTIHIINSDDYFLPEGTLSAIGASKKMVFEIDMTEMNDIGAIMGLMDKIFMSDNKTLKDLISEEDYKIVDEHFQKLGMPLMMLQRMKPMFLTVFASGDMDPSGLQNGSMKSYEMEFMEMAQNANLPIAGLETIEFQLSVFDSIPYEAQANMLVETIKLGSEGNDEFDKMIEMYTTQNISDMVEMISDDGEQLSEYEDILLTKRNKAWISGMKTMMSEMPTFFAVGAGHLAGENGVINLLKKEGYTLTPLSHKKS